MALGRKQQPTFVLEDYKILDQLHYDRQVVFVQHATTGKNYVMKSIEFPAGMANPQVEAQKTHRLIASSFPLALRPELFCIRQETTGFRLMILQPRMPISLQKILTVYREKSAFLSRRFVEGFLQGLYNMVWKLNEQRMYHGNLKPSNIFYKEGGWQVSECGLLSCRINKYYAKGFEPTFDRQKSIQYCLAVDQMSELGLTRDLYSLGVIALEMMSMQRISTIYEELPGRENKAQLRHTLDGCAKRYGAETAEFVKSLIETSPNNSREAYKRFKNSQNLGASGQLGSSGHFQNPPEEEIRIQSYMNTEYALALPELDELYERIRASKESCNRTLENFHAADEHLSFRLESLAAFSSVLEGSYGFALPFDRAVQLWEYFTTVSQMRYINILREVYPIDEVIRVIIGIVSKSFSRPRDFFDSYNKSAEFWTVSAFKNLLDSGDIEVAPEQLRGVIRQLTRDQKREYLTFKEFVKVFGLGDTMTESVVAGLDHKKSSNNITSSQNIPTAQYDNELSEMLSLLQMRVPNMSLYRFFRDHDPKMRWVCDSTIDRHIRDKVRMPEDKLRKALEQMWSSRAGIPGERESDRKLKYLVLLADSKLEKPADLFKMVLTDKINLLDFAHFFDKYKLDKEGWTFESLMEINKDEQLEFHERDLKQFFKALDKDGSQTISEKELKEKLTGLKEFSESVYVENLKEYAASLKKPVAELFFDQDRSKSLQFGHTSELQAVFDQAKLQLSPEHCEQLFSRYCKRDKFEYVDFLKQFYKEQPEQLFKQVLVFVMRQQFDNDFQRVYKMGISGDRTKWNAKSLEMVNDDMMLGFTTAELKEIWKRLDEKDDQSLSRTEVSRLFDIKYEKESYEPEEEEQPQEQKKPRRFDSKRSEVASNKDLFPKVAVKKESRTSVKELERELTLKEKMIQEVENNDILRELAARCKKRDLLNIFFEQDVEHRFSLSYAEFEAALRFLGIEVKKGAVNMYTKAFQFDSSEREVRINFIKLILFLNSLDENEAESKSATILNLLRKFMSVRRCSIDDLLASGRNKNKWTISSLESFLSKSLDSQIFYDDIEIVWQYWNCGEELDRKELVEILEKGYVEGKTKKYTRELRDEEYQRQSPSIKGEYTREEPRGKVQIPQIKKRNSSNKGQYDENWTLHTQGEGSPTRTKDRVIEEEEYADDFEKEKESPKAQRKSSTSKREESYGLKGKHSKQEDSDEDDRGRRKIEQVTPKGDGSPNRRNSKKSPTRKESEESSRGFAMRAAEDISFMNKPNEEYRRPNVDDEQVKYTTDKSEEIGWGGVKETIQEEPKSQRGYSQKEIAPRRAESMRVDRKKEKEAQEEFSKVLAKVGFKELERLANRDKIEQVDFRETLVMRYRLRKDLADSIAQALSKNGRISLTELKEAFGAPPSQPPSLSPRVFSSFKEGSNYLSSSQHLPQKRPKLNGALIREHIRTLMNQFSKKTDVNDLPHFFFGKSQLIDLDQFCDKCSQINRNISRAMLEQLFSYMNPIKGQVSLLAFRTAFHQSGEMGGDELEFPPELEKELKEVFTKADKDKSGSINKEELPQLLSNFGLNMTTKQIQGFFKDIDKDRSNAIDFTEFKEFLTRTAFSQLSNFEESVDLLRRELRNADLFNCGSLQNHQLKAALAKLGVQLTENELIELTIEMGKDGRINIEELIEQVANVSECKLRNTIRMTLFKIRFLKRITIKDIRATFSKLSSCFTIAYSYQNMRSLSLLPSTSLRPKLDSSGLFFSDYFYTNINAIDPAKSSLERIARYNQLALEIRFDEATGIPIPLETTIVRSSILRRSVYVSFFDGSQERSRDSVCWLDAQWDPDQEDLWKFGTDKGFDRGLFVKVGDYEDSKFTSYSLLFEFVMTVIDGSSTIDINCGSASLMLGDVSRITSAVDRKLEISGGIPSKKRFLRKEDVLARRTGWRKLISGDPESVLKIEVLPTAKFRDKLPMLDILPLRIILNKSSLSFFRYFRQYFAEKAVSKGRINLSFANDYKIKAFLAGIDCRQIYDQMIPAWNNIEQRCSQRRGKLKGLVEAKTAFECLCKELFVVVSSREFGYLPSCPTFDSLGNKTLETSRLKLVKDAMQNLQNFVKKIPLKKRQLDPASFSPFIVADQQQPLQDNVLARLKKSVR